MAWRKGRYGLHAVSKNTETLEANHSDRRVSGIDPHQYKSQKEIEGRENHTRGKGKEKPVMGKITPPY